MAGEVHRLDGLAVPAELARLHDLLAEVAAAHPDLGPADLIAVETAVVEVAGNVVEHATPPGQVAWRLEVRVDPDGVTAELSDSGAAGTTPWLSDGESSGTTSDQTLQVADMPDELAESGRGLPLAAALLDELTYRREDDRNVWTMRRNRST